MLRGREKNFFGEVSFWGQIPFAESWAGVCSTSLCTIADSGGITVAAVGWAFSVHMQGRPCVHYTVVEGGGGGGGRGWR